MAYVLYVRPITIIPGQPKPPPILLIKPSDHAKAGVIPSSCTPQDKVLEFLKPIPPALEFEAINNMTVRVIEKGFSMGSIYSEAEKELQKILEIKKYIKENPSKLRERHSDLIEKLQNKLVESMQEFSKRHPYSH